MHKKIRERKSRKQKKKIRLVVDRDMSIVLTGVTNFQKYAKLISSVEATGSFDSPDKLIYQKTNELNAHVLTCNYKDFKGFIKKKSQSGVIGCSQPLTKKVEQNAIGLFKKYSNQDICGKLIVVDNEGIKTKKNL